MVHKKKLSPDEARGLSAIHQNILTMIEACGQSIPDYQKGRLKDALHSFYLEAREENPDEKQMLDALAHTVRYTVTNAASIEPDLYREKLTPIAGQVTRLIAHTNSMEAIHTMAVAFVLSSHIQITTAQSAELGKMLKELHQQLETTPRALLTVSNIVWDLAEELQTIFPALVQLGHDYKGIPGKEYEEDYRTLLTPMAEALLTLTAPPLTIVHGAKRTADLEQSAAQAITVAPLQESRSAKVLAFPAR